MLKLDGRDDHNTNILERVVMPTKVMAAVTPLSANSPHYRSFAQLGDVVKQALAGINSPIEFGVEWGGTVYTVSVEQDRDQFICKIYAHVDATERHICWKGTQIFLIMKPGVGLEQFDSLSIKLGLQGEMTARKMRMKIHTSLDGAAQEFSSQNKQAALAAAKIRALQADSYPEGSMVKTKARLGDGNIWYLWVRRVRGGTWVTCGIDGQDVPAPIYVPYNANEVIRVSKETPWSQIAFMLGAN